ncbi:MAG: prepilin-type N-terminal cleavage/methylation domain-containing protein [Desulfosoma sp.]
MRVLGKAPRDFAQKGAKHDFQAAVGFTLVEVLVAMVLTAMVITLLATALRSGLLSWSKLGPESQADIFAHAVPVSLGRYLEYTPTEATPWKGEQGQLFPLCGDRHGIAFYSTYGPSGSNRQGLRLIGYLYDPSRRILEVYDLELYEKEDQATDWVVLAETLLNGRQDLGPPMSRYGDVTAFEVAYAELSPSDASGRELQWKDQWPCKEVQELPRQVRVVFGVRTGSAEKVNTWVFPTRIQ